MKRLPIIGTIAFLFLSSPVFASSFSVETLGSYFILGLLLLVGFLSLVFGLVKSKLALGFLVSLTSFSAFFLMASPSGYDNSHLMYFIIGLVLLLIEFIVPGFTFTGLAGILLMSFSVILTVDNQLYGTIMYVLVLTITGLVVVYLFKHGYYGEYIDKLLLKETSREESVYNNSIYLGQKGVVITDMRPSGTVKIGDEKVDAISEGIYISKGEEVEVVKVEGNKIIIRRV